MIGSRFLFGLVAAVMVSQTGLAQSEGTNIIGTDEAPNSLNLVPWKDRDMSTKLWQDHEQKAVNILDVQTSTMDEDELRRQMEYFNLLHRSSP